MACYVYDLTVNNILLLFILLLFYTLFSDMYFVRGLGLGRAFTCISGDMRMELLDILKDTKGYDKVEIINTTFLSE